MSHIIRKPVNVCPAWISQHSSSVWSGLSLSTYISLQPRLSHQGNDGCCDLYFHRLENPRYRFSCDKAQIVYDTAHCFHSFCTPKGTYYVILLVVRLGGWASAHPLFPCTANSSYIYEGISMKLLDIVYYNVR